MPVGNFSLLVLYSARPDTSRTSGHHILRRYHTYVWMYDMHVCMCALYSLGCFFSRPDPASSPLLPTHKPNFIYLFLLFSFFLVSLSLFYNRLAVLPYLYEGLYTYLGIPAIPAADSYSLSFLFSSRRTACSVVQIQYSRSTTSTNRITHVAFRYSTQ